MIAPTALVAHVLAEMADRCLEAAGMAFAIVGAWAVLRYAYHHQARKSAVTQGECNPWSI